MNEKISKYIGLAFSCWLCFIFVSRIAAKDVTITVVKTKDLEPYNEAYNGFIEVLTKANINFKTKILNLDHHKNSIAHIVDKIRNKKPDLILTIGTKATQEISQRITEIPIVFSMVLDPKAQGLKHGNKHSGKNLSGVCLDIPLETQFNMLLQTQLQLTRIAVLFNPNRDSVVVDQMRRIAEKRGIELVPGIIQSEEDIPEVLKSIYNNSDVLWLIHNPHTISYTSLKYILMFCITNNFPVIGLSEHHVKAGALFAMRADYHDNGRQAGDLALTVFNKGSIKKQIIYLPRKTKLYVNKRAADMMGFEIPKALLRQAEPIKE